MLLQHKLPVIRSDLLCAWYTNIDMMSATASLLLLLWLLLSLLLLTLGLRFCNQSFEAVIGSARSSVLHDIFMLLSVESFTAVMCRKVCRAHHYVVAAWILVCKLFGVIGLSGVGLSQHSLLLPMVSVTSK